MLKKPIPGLLQRFTAAHVRSPLKKSNTCAFDLRCSASMPRLTARSSTPCQPLAPSCGRTQPKAGSRQPTQPHQKSPLLPAGEGGRRPGEGLKPPQPRRESPLPPAGEGGRRPGEGLKPPQPRHSHPAHPQAAPSPRRYPVAIRPCRPCAGAHHRRDTNDPPVSATAATLTLTKLLAWRPGGYLRASGVLFGWQGRLPSASRKRISCADADMRPSPRRPARL